MKLLPPLLREMDAGRPVALVTVLQGPPGSKIELGAKAVVGQTGILATTMLDPAVLAEAARLGQLSLSAQHPVTAEQRLGPAAPVRLYAEPYLPPPELIICGAGHVAQALAQIAVPAGFVVTVLDDRYEYAQPQRFPLARQVLAGPLGNLLRGLPLGSRHHVLVATRDEQHDLECLRTVLSRPVAYVGMVGSRRRVQTVRGLLAEAGVQRALTANLYAPVGLDIGAGSPAEIAVSVAAELIRIRRGGTGEHLARLDRPRVHSPRCRPPAPEAGLLRLLAHPEHPWTEGALATVIRTWGHCPREAGAKMLIARTGETCGSVGGGWGEAEVRRLAAGVIESGQPALHLVDLTGDPSVPQAAACGGKMEFFVEPLTGAGRRGAGDGE